MLVEVELRGFNDYVDSGIRYVDVPDSKIPSANMALNNEVALMSALDKVFYYGQNDFQPKQQRSVSVGDVVRLYGQRWTVAMVGWKQAK